MDARSLVFDVPDEISGWGRLVRTSDGDWFDPPLARTLVGYSDGPPAPRPSGSATPVEGADFDAVDQRYERDGAMEGYARIHGRWLGDHISVHHQTLQRPERHLPQWTDPPCAPPPGGWPLGMNGSSPNNLDFDLGDLEDTGAAVSVVVFRPGPERAVLVVVANDVPAVEAQLRPQLRDRLCVVASRFTRQQLDEAQEHLRAMWEPWCLISCGRSSDEHGQATITASLVRVTDEIASWAATLPTGLLALEPCLTPSPATGHQRTP